MRHVVRVHDDGQIVKVLAGMSHGWRDCVWIMRNQ